MNKYKIAAIAAINGLDSNEYRKLTAKEQREMFGYVPFGRQDVRFDSADQGKVTVRRSVCFGTDCAVMDYSFDEFAQLVNDRKPARV